jgi:hypothetical protein
MKPLGAGNYNIRPFKAYKFHTYTVTYPSSSDSTGRIRIDEALVPPDNWIWSGSSEPINADGIYKRSLFATAQNQFYAIGSFSSSLVTDYRQRLYYPSGAFYTINVSQTGYGEGIKPESFVLSSSGGIIVDDGNGRLYRNTTTGSVIGNIFYGLGLAFVNQNSGSIINSGGMWLLTGSQVTVQYNSTVTIYEHQVICTVEPGELNWSSNPTINPTTISSSVSGSNKIIDYFASGTLTPYMTTIGLYDSPGNLVAIAKVPRAIKRTPDMSQTFIVKWDI